MATVWLPYDLAQYRVSRESELAEFWDLLFIRDWKEHDFYAWVALAHKDEILSWAHDIYGKDGNDDRN